MPTKTSTPPSSASYQLKPSSLQTQCSFETSASFSDRQQVIRETAYYWAEKEGFSLAEIDRFWQMAEEPSNPSRAH